MGAGGVTNRSTIKINGKRGDLPVRSEKPNTRYDLYVNGKKVQSRWFDENGRAVRNRDYDHQDGHHNHEFPHDHDWTWVGNHPIRDPNGLSPNYDNFN